MIAGYKQPPLRRTPMGYQPFLASSKKGKFCRVLAVRRFLFLSLVSISTGLAGFAFTTIMTAGGHGFLSGLIVVIYVALFGWGAFNFWTVFFGFVAILFGENRKLVLSPAGQPIEPNTRIALIMPVYNEEMSRIYSSLRAVFESLKETGQSDRFDIFILSDSVKSEYVLMEETAWSALCQDVDGYGRIFYRRRKLRIHKKSGNVSDFCRRWGSQYKYMIIFDADSLMQGDLLIRMVNTMETRADIGILQTAPMAMNQVSLVSRLQQFASYVYGPLFFAGLRFWQLDESGYWGHNAIIRMAPFMKYCALPKLSGGPPFGGEILSHDFVEAALMRRAGWGVWLAYELEGSYEELPPNLLEELERDRRWCQGNIQHLRLIFMKGVTFGHRLLFLNGNLFYFSSFLLFLLLILMTIHAGIIFFSQPVYFPLLERTLFPHWPVQYRALSVQLLIVTAGFLLIPKVLSVVVIALSPGKAARFGGLARLTVSVFLEIVFSTLLAPLRMIFHAWYVVLNLVGQKLVWRSSMRSSGMTSFGEASRAYGIAVIVAIVWGGVACGVNRTLFWWNAVILIPLFLAIPIAVVFSHPAAGIFFRKHGLFLTPEEISPAKVLRRFQEFFKSNV